MFRLQLKVLLLFPGVPADFCKPLRNQECQEKESVVFECGMTKANIDVQWFINGEELSPDDEERFEISTDIYTQQLIIHDVKLKDQGEIKCVCGDNWTKASLTVEGENIFEDFHLRMV